MYPGFNFPSSKGKEDGDKYEIVEEIIPRFQVGVDHEASISGYRSAIAHLVHRTCGAETLPGDLPLSASCLSGGVGFPGLDIRAGNHLAAPQPLEVMVQAERRPQHRHGPDRGGCFASR